MNRRIMALALTVVLLFSICKTVMPSLAATQTLTITVTVDKENVKPGDTVTATVSIGAITNLQCVWVKVVIPEGLTYVTGSEKTMDNVQSELGGSPATFNEEAMIFLADARCA